MSNIIFYERQYFRVWWVWVVLLIPFIIFLFALMSQLVINKPLGVKPIDKLGSTAFGFSYLALVALMAICRLETKMYKDHIAIRYFPFVPIYLKFYKSEIDIIEPVKYDPLSDALGWGIKLSRKWGLVYSISGNEAISIKMKNGKKYLIGSSDMDNFKRALVVWELNKFIN